MLLKIPSGVFIEITLYLQPGEVFQTLPTLSHAYFNRINNEDYKCIWLGQYLGIELALTSELLIKALKNFKSNEILDFVAWITNGGLFEAAYLKNSYAILWTYSPEIYSTKCEYDPNLPLMKNVCCFAYFSGSHQKKQFERYYNTLIDQILSRPNSIPDEYLSWRECDLTKLLVLDPLASPSKKFSSAEEYFDQSNFLGDEFDDGRTISEPKSTDFLPIIKKIAVARILLFSGFVKSFLFIFSRKSFAANYEDFDRFNNIDAYENTRKLGKEIQHLNNNECEFVEFEESDSEFYPAAWVSFKTWKVNHLILEFKRCHYAKFACVKLIGVEDNRDMLALGYYQLNYDVMYTLLIGSIVQDPLNFP